MRLRNKNTGPIGVDIGGRTVRLVQLRRKSGAGEASLEVIAAGQREISPSDTGNDEALRNALREIVSEQKFIGKTAVTCLPFSDVSIKNIRLPEMPESELLAAAAFEAKERFAHLGDDCVIRAVPVGRVGTDADPQQELIVFAVKPEFIDSRLGMMTEVGLEVAGIETAANAFFRPFERFLQRSSDAEVPVALVEVGYRGAQITLARGGDIVFAKHCDVGGAEFDRAISQSMRIPLHEATALRDQEWGDPDRDSFSGDISSAIQGLLQKLAKEISLSLRYFSVTFRGDRPECVHLGGRETSMALSQMLAEEIDMPVELADPFRGIDTQRASELGRRKFDGAGWTRAVGLALRRLKSVSARKVA